MRKCLSLLLAVIMALLPAASLAEGRQFDVSFSYDAEAFAQIMDEMLALTAEMSGEDTLEIIPGTEIRELADMMTTLINCSSFTAYTQPGGVKLVFSMQEKEVCSVFVTWDEQEVAVTTNILPGVKLSLPLEAVQDALADLNTVDWAALAGDMANRAFRWASSLRGHGAVGTFSGDAYDGGLRRVEYALTDADVAALLESLLLGLESNDAVMALLDALFGETNVAQAIRSFREYSNNVAMTSRYHYTFSMVYGEQDALIGLSLNVLEEDELIATVSLGANTEGDRLTMVASIPLGSGVVYIDNITTLTAQDGSETMATSFGVYQSDSMISYQQAAKDETLRTYYWDYAISTARENGKQVNTITGLVDGIVSERIEMVQTIGDDPFSFEEISRMWFGDAETPAMIVTTAGKPFDGSLTHGDDLTVINILDMTSEDEAAMETAMETGMQEMTVRLFQALPAEMLTMLMQMQ